jgi:hypothetical protein
MLNNGTLRHPAIGLRSVALAVQFGAFAVFRHTTSDRFQLCS